MHKLQFFKKPEQQNQNRKTHNISRFYQDSGNPESPKKTKMSNQN